MQTTYHIKASEINLSLLESIRKMFKENDSVVLTVKSETREDQQQHRMFLKSEELQKEYPPIKVSVDIDLSALANDVNV